MAQNPHKPTGPETKPSLSDQVEGLIKRTEERQKEAPQVQEAVQRTQEGAAEVMAGVEKPKEKVSERKGETGEKGDISGGGAATTGDENQMQTDMGAVTLPSEEIMIKKIRAAISHDIKIEMKRAVKLKRNLTQGTAQEYSSVIARIRALKEKLASLWTATTDFVKGMYLHYFTPDGKRRRVE